MLARPIPVDSEIAAATFKDHLEVLWANGMAAENGWGRIPIDPLHCIVSMNAKKQDGSSDHYFIRFGAEYYDRWPPSVKFVTPDEWKPVSTSCRWWPQMNFPDWFRLHLEHPLAGNPGQLVCFSFTAEYYMTDHNPPEAAVWKPGKHTLSATLTKLQEALSPPYYLGRSV